ncbi:MAG: DUF721 domain-containing protein [Thermoleophilia bacterium]|nr:DUF721 domain-containing protein [Thermoleophilia bacterium]
MDDRPNIFVDPADLGRAQLRGMGSGFGLVLEAFGRIAGPALARVALPVALRGGTLTIRCASASWVQAIGFQEAELLAALHRELPSLALTRIRAVTGSVAPSVSSTPGQAPAAPPLAPLPAGESARLDALVAGISDATLAARVRAAAEASARRAHS